MDEIRLPIIFVTGIGQTWSSLKGDKHRWNLIPGDKEVLFYKYPKMGYLRLAKAAIKAVPTVITGFPGIKQKSLNKIADDLFHYCQVDDNGNLPEEVNVRLYGSRSFTELRHVDFNTGDYTENGQDTLLARLYRDIPCRDLAATYGTDYMFCFNYSTFSDLYDSADRLHLMIKEVLKKVDNGAKQVVLIPMSMGATVVNAYLDKYYTDDGAKEENMVARVVSIVGAWNGSDGLADLLTLNGGNGFDERFYGQYLPKVLGDKAKYLKFINRKATDKLLGQVLDAVLDAVLLRVSSFMALLPYERFSEAEARLFTAERMLRLPRCEKTVKEAYAYHNAQGNLENRLKGLASHLGMEFYFICGWGLPLGAGSRDFEMLGLFDSAEKSDSDGVIQISSTAPGTKEGELPTETPGAWFADRCWYFYKQPHELGSNNTALKLAVGIASGDIKKAGGSFPQINESRDIREAEELLAKAGELSAAGSVKHREALQKAVDDVKNMLSSTVNHREQDDRLVHCLKERLLEENLPV